jgi:hypothetical protein
MPGARRHEGSAPGTRPQVVRGPETLECMRSGQTFSLADGSPAMLKKVLKGRWAAIQKEKLVGLLSKRSEALTAAEAAGGADSKAGFVGQLPGVGEGMQRSKVADLLCKPTTSLHAKKGLLSAAWGVFPFGVWLAQHGRHRPQHR